MSVDATSMRGTCRLDSIQESHSHASPHRQASAQDTLHARHLRGDVCAESLRVGHDLRECMSSDETKDLAEILGNMKRGLRLAQPR